MGQLKDKFIFLQYIREYFTSQGFLELTSPPAVQNPGMETHIHPFQLYSAHQKKPVPLFLHTSPEFMLKEAFVRDPELDKIFSIGYSFRDEPTSPIHRPQFLMMEWYRKGEHYTKIMNDTKELIVYLLQRMNPMTTPQFREVTVQDLFFDYLNIDILNYLDKEKLKQLIKDKFTDVPLPASDCDWDDYFFLLFLNKIEPHFRTIPYLLVKEFPAPLAALSTLKAQDPRVCERFELYAYGVELCNCFNEVTDESILEKRFKQQTEDKQRNYDYALPWPERFMETMKNGYPASTGNALGLERLYAAITQQEPNFWD